MHDFVRGGGRPLATNAFASYRNPASHLPPNTLGLMAFEEH